MKERIVNGAGEAMARHVRAEGEILSKVSFEIKLSSEKQRSI